MRKNSNLIFFYINCEVKVCLLNILNLFFSFRFLNEFLLIENNLVDVDVEIDVIKLNDGVNLVFSNLL